MNFRYFACQDCKTYTSAGYRWAYWKLEHPGIVQPGAVVDVPDVLNASDYWNPPQDDGIFEKSVNSALKNPELLGAIQSINPVAVVVVGMATDACVTATAREANDLGHSTIVVGEACATFSRLSLAGASIPAALVQEVSLAALAASGIQVCAASKAIELVAC